MYSNNSKEKGRVMPNIFGDEIIRTRVLAFLSGVVVVFAT